MATTLDPSSALSATVPYQASLPPFCPTFCTSYEVYTFRFQLFLKDHVAPTTRVATREKFHAE